MWANKIGDKMCKIWLRNRNIEQTYTQSAKTERIACRRTEKLTYLYIVKRSFPQAQATHKTAVL